MEIMEINGYELEQTCGACPEQYDVFKNGKQVGYLRLRHGIFIACMSDAGGEIVYKAYPEADGIFDSVEREKYLTAAIDVID